MLRLNAIELEVNPDSGKKEVHWIAGSVETNRDLEVAESAHFHFVNGEDSPGGVVLEKLAEDPAVLRPAEVFGFQLFRDLFSEDSIATGLSLELGAQPPFSSPISLYDSCAGCAGSF